FQRMVGDVGGTEFVHRLRQDARHVHGDVADADDNHVTAIQVDLQVYKVGMAIIPGDKLCGREAPGQVFARDVELAVGLCADGVDDLVVVAAQGGVGQVRTKVDVAEEAKTGVGGRAVIDLGHRFNLLVVGRDAIA